MKLRQTQSVGLKQRLSSTLRSWLPILQSSLEELTEKLKEYEESNPYLEVRSGYETGWDASFSRPSSVRSAASEGPSRADVIEAISTYDASLYERLHEQIGPPLFPTPRSERVARTIVEEISCEGYFEGDIALVASACGVSVETAERIRLRFAQLEPPGVGARNVPEAMLFQLRQSDVQEPLYSLVAQMLESFDNISDFKTHPLYEEAIAVIRTFHNPPAMEMMEDSPPIIPDLVVEITSEGVDLRINDDFYPDISIKEEDLDHEFVKKKIKEARDLIDALQMRKATLYKIGLMIVEFQYDFFLGGEMRPMKLKDIAEEFEHNPSTISRAIANKYLLCDRGIFPMKAFFNAGLDEEVSNAAIKNFIAETIAREDRKKPLSDQKLLEMIEEKFGVKMVRRTVTKYRKQLNIGGSSERKRFYQLA